MIKYLLFFVPILFVFSNAWADVSIYNDQQYIGDDQALHIVGEIQNDLNVPISQIDVHVTLYTTENKEIDTLTTSSLVNTIMPGMKGPFDLVIFGNKAKLVDSYSVDLDYQFVTPKSQVIDITSSQLERDNFDNLVITGTVANKGEITANTISIVATMYDREGKVASVSRILTEPDYLRSTDEAFFLVSVSDKTRADEVVDYSIVAESEEYAPVPEFPVGSMILLASSVTVYVVITRYSRLVITNLVPASYSR